jgi:glycosyltransferase involved in cell wall biosynthesis
VHQKAIDTVIRALALLPASVRLVVVGEGPDKAALQKLSQELHVEERVQFVGHVDRSETAKYRKVCDIFVMPSRSEGQGISFLSTMLSGLPIVATQEGGIADFLFDAKRNPGQPTTGWAVDKDSPEQIAAAVKEIQAHPEEVREVTETARELMHKKYDWDVIAKDMKEKVFKRVI